MKSGIDLITDERQEQLFKHKRTVKHDVENNNEFQLVDAASTLMMYTPEGFEDTFLVDVHGQYTPVGWSQEIWEKMLRKPYKERLAIAGALISAEIDRITKLEENVLPKGA